MSYQILYTAKGAVHKRIKNNFQLPVMICCIILLAGIAAHIIWPDEVKTLKTTLFPWKEYLVVHAFGRMNDRILDGVSVKDSVAVFCRDLIIYAEH